MAGLAPLLFVALCCGLACAARLEAGIIARDGQPKRALLYTVPSTVPSSNSYAGGRRSLPSKPSAGPGISGQAAAKPGIMDFSGRSFSLDGLPGRFYKVLEDHKHQITMHLQQAEQLERFGAYIDGMGFDYMGTQVLVQLQADTSLQVTVDGEHLGSQEGLKTMEYSKDLPNGKLHLSLSLQRPHTVTIETDLLRMEVCAAHAGIAKGDGAVQRAFLIFTAQLLFPTSDRLKGVVGEGYNRVLDGVAQNYPDDGSFIGNPDDYLLPGYFPRLWFPLTAYGGQLTQALSTGHASRRARALLAA